MFSFLKNLFKRKNLINVDIKAETVPEAFGFPEDQYQQLVKELTTVIEKNDRLIAFNDYVHNPLFEKFKLDLQNPQHAAVLGYAFCAAVFIQRSIQQQVAANKVLEAFYPAAMPQKKFN